MIARLFCFVAALFSVLKKKETVFCVGRAWTTLMKKAGIIALQQWFNCEGLHGQEFLLLQAGSASLDGHLLPEAWWLMVTLLWEFRGAQHHSPQRADRPQQRFLSSQQCLNGKGISYRSAHGQRAACVPQLCNHF